MIELIEMEIEFMETASQCVFSEFGIGIWYDTRMSHAESPVYYVSPRKLSCGKYLDGMCPWIVIPA